MVRFTIDRFYENHAICLDENMQPRTLYRSELPKEAQPGHTLFFEDNRWQIDHEQTNARAKRIGELYERLKGRTENDETNNSSEGSTL
jgi:hypothetical protein